MIYTVTFNPAIDYVVHTDAMQVGMVNRSRTEEIYYGGKGINVSMVLKELGLVTGMHAAKEYSVGMALQFPDLPSLKSESAIRQAVGFLKTAKHIIKDGKDQMAPLIESDENRELFRSLVQEIKEIISEDVTETTTG